MFDVFLLDLSLPESRGLPTIATLQLQEPDKPIIALTGFSCEDIALQAVSRGAQDYLVTGEFTLSVVMRSIRYAIDRKKAKLR